MIEPGNITPFSVWALVPVKASYGAKTRLSGMLSAAERIRLQWTMLEDVLNQLGKVRWLTGSAIVCPDETISNYALARGISVFYDEPESGGLNAAVACGTQRLREEGADVVVVVPGDVPTLDPAEVGGAIRCAVQENTTVVVPDQEAEGTNALIFWTKETPRFSFGNRSFQRHLKNAGGECAKPLQLASIACDIDRPEDLEALRSQCRQGAAPNTGSVLAKFNYLEPQQAVEGNR